ncbi:hypothetical protein E4U53_005125 [Claviceps sorghi]|nr:hypothetical protein E4U53_005125 [Claviceps sorghi]
MLVYHDRPAAASSNAVPPWAAAQREASHRFQSLGAWLLSSARGQRPWQMMHLGPLVDPGHGGSESPAMYGVRDHDSAAATTANMERLRLGEGCSARTKAGLQPMASRTA